VYSVADCVPRLIQQNDGSGFFNRSWAEYKAGFGEPSGNYWLGNDLLSQLTANNRYKLKFDLQQDGTGSWYSAKYSRFRVLSEADNYTLQAGGFSGNASYDALGPFNGQHFSTFDHDNDVHPSLNCAAAIAGGFWYKRCGGCRVNGARRIGWFHWQDLPGGWHLQYARMWLQCK